MTTLAWITLVGLVVAFVVVRRTVGPLLAISIL